MTRILAALALIGLLAACSSGSSEPAPSTPSASVQSISKADLEAVVTSLCLEPATKVMAVLNHVADADIARFGRVLDAMTKACPDVMAEVNKVAAGG